MFVQAGLDKPIRCSVRDAEGVLYYVYKEELLIYLLTPSGMENKIAHSVYVQTYVHIYLSET